MKRLSNCGILPEMKIVLATINARYSHTSFGLRYLKANLKEFENDCEIMEFTQDLLPQEIAERIIAQKPDVVGFGCYIWNIEAILKTAEIVRAILPQTVLVLGGPEVSYENEAFLPHCDYLIEGEGELALYHLVQDLANGKRPAEKILKEPVCDLTQIKLPYYLYSNEDIAHRLIYVEATRGCPFCCEFCLSSLSHGVREFDLDEFLAEMDVLVGRGVRQFKFVDRTFNLKIDRIKKILGFFKARWHDGMVLHFEIFPDRLNAEMLEEIKNFPAGGLHLEAGVQSFYEPALKAISRKQDEEKTLENLRIIREQSGAEIHADLVAGIPEATLKTFEDDFNKLIAVRPQELQIGILKRLRGAPIDRHSSEYAMVYSKYPPYEIMQNKDMPYADLQLVKRVARYFDLYYNSGNFKNSCDLLLTAKGSAFQCWADFSSYIWENCRQTHKISIGRQTRILFDYLCRFCNIKEVAAALSADYRAQNRSDNINYIKEVLK